MNGYISNNERYACLLWHMGYVKRKSCITKSLYLTNVSMLAESFTMHVPKRIQVNTIL